MNTPEWPEWYGFVAGLVIGHWLAIVIMALLIVKDHQDRNP